MHSILFGGTASRASRVTLHNYISPDVGGQGLWFVYKNNILYAHRSIQIGVFAVRQTQVQVSPG